jgi:endoglucanase
VGEEAQQWIGATWDGTAEEKSVIDNDFDSVSEWAALNNRPVHLGEFGAYSVADDDSRERWTRYVREAAEQRGFSWAYWEFGAGFGIYDRDAKVWRQELLRALLPDSPEVTEG